MANIKQSTIVAKYISTLAGKESKYYGELKLSKMYVDSTLYKWLWIGWFISDEVKELD